MTVPESVSLHFFSNKNCYEWGPSLTVGLLTPGWRCGASVGEVCGRAVRAPSFIDRCELWITDICTPAHVARSASGLVLAKGLFALRAQADGMSAIRLVLTSPTATSEYSAPGYR
jgi:hypothetical protein